MYVIFEWRTDVSVGCSVQKPRAPYLSEKAKKAHLSEEKKAKGGERFSLPPFPLAVFGLECEVSIFLIYVCVYMGGREEKNKRGLYPSN